MKPSISFPTKPYYELPPLSEFIVREVPTMLLGYLHAHGYEDARPAEKAGSIVVKQYFVSHYTGQPYTTTEIIQANMADVRRFLGYPK